MISDLTHSLNGNGSNSLKSLTMITCDIVQAGDMSQDIEHCSMFPRAKATNEDKKPNGTHMVGVDNTPTRLQSTDL